MKLIRILIVTILFVGFLAVPVANSGPVEKGKMVDVEYGCFIDCMDEWAEGFITYTWKNTPSGFQWKVKGIVYGLVSENAYEISEVQNIRLPKDKLKGAITNTYTYTFSVCLDGQEIGVFHSIIHATVNANGIEVSDVRHFVMECY